MTTQLMAHTIAEINVVVNEFYSLKIYSNGSIINHNCESDPMLHHRRLPEDMVWAKKLQMTVSVGLNV